MELGKRIARRRKELGLKQVEVCEKAEINDKYLSCIERATSIPSLDVVMRLAYGDDIKTVQNNLGHATASFTLDVYGHVTEQMKRDSSSRMEHFIQGISELR